ncbi:MAG: hypothetical protein U9R42_14850 [Bacteroidota bacterium]|nr:hypothetical protein [Bacteroidota bacterium]
MKRLLLISLIFLFCSNILSAQKSNTFYNFEDALKLPDSVYKLDLSYKNLRLLPIGIEKFKNLEVLNISHNNFIKLPDSLSSLKKLKYLNVSYNTGILSIELFRILSKVKSLEKLDISSCQLLYIPYQIELLKSLKILNISSNKLNHLPKEIRELRHLEKLLVANNNLIFLPDELIYLESLKTIDLSFNTNLNYKNVFEILSSIKSLKIVKIRGMKKIPDELTLLQTIKFLDLSYSDFNDCTRRLNRLDSLETLVLKNCRNIDYGTLFTKFSSLYKLKTLEIADNNISKLPQGLGRIKNLEKIIITASKLEFISSDIYRLFNLKSLSINFTPLINTEELIRSIYKIESLDTLDLSYCNLGFLPTNIEELKQISVLNLMANNLTSLPFAVTKTKIKKIIIKDNPIQEITISDLKKKMPNCTFVNDKEELTNTSFSNKHENLKVKSQKFTINTKKDTNIVSKNGTKIFIPKNSFSHIKNDNIILLLSEYVSPFDFICLDNNYKNKKFSAKVYDFKIQDESSDAKLKLGKKIIIGFKSELGKTKNIYHLNKENFEWEIDKKSGIIKNSISENKQFNNEQITLEKPIYLPPEIVKEDIFFDFLTPFTSRNFIFKVDGSFGNFSNRHFYDYVKSYPEMKYLSRIKWNYDGKNANKDFRYFKSIVRNTIKYEKYKIEDIILETNPSEDNYKLKFLYKNDTIIIPVFAEFVNERHESIQKHNKKFYENYKQLLNKRIEHWNYVDSSYRAVMNVYQTKMNSYRDYLTTNKIESNKSENIVEIKIDKLGLWKFGNPLKTEKTFEYYVKLYDENNNSLQAEKLFVINTTKASVNSFENRNKIKFDKKSNNVLVVFLKNGKIAYLKESDFKRMMNQKSDIKALRLNIIDNKDISLDELKNILK